MKSESAQEKSHKAVTLTFVGVGGTGGTGNKRGCFSPRSLQAVMLFS